MRSPGGSAAAIRGLIRIVQRGVPRGAPGITILAYHLVGAGTDSPVDVPLEVFRGQMEGLHRLGCVTSLTAAAGAIGGGRPLEADRVVLTFDDAFGNFATRALPVLRELGLPSTLFVPTDFVDGTAPAPLAGAERLPAMTWGQLRAAAEEGLVELGSHTRSHPDLRTVSDARLDDEIGGAARVIEERTGFRPGAFCYPRAHFDRRAEVRVRGTYRCAVVGGGRKNRQGASPWRLQRVSLRRDMPASLDGVLGSTVVLEEWLANRVRGLRPRRPAGGTEGTAAGEPAPR